MPKSKKPRRKYSPARHQVKKNTPRMDSIYLLFQPIYTAFDRLADGEIEVSRGKPQRLRSPSSIAPRRSSSTPADRLKHVGNLTMPRQKFLRLLALSSKTRKLERITRNERTRPDV